jgi:hypothetical protein
VEAVQLRPASILFIDDNPGNRGEAAVHVPELQVSDEKIIPGLLKNVLCVGKSDRELTRLNQYKVLEKRSQDQIKAGGNNHEFLKSSDIRISFEHNVEAHIDRAVELINRTNQLNFTKVRLSDDIATARAELKREISSFNRQAGLIRVRDKYGDYGLVGVYVTHGTSTANSLIHFCFSCRTIGMGVERWVYDALSRPRIKIVGEVLTDLNSQESVNWINASVESSSGDIAPVPRSIPEVRIRGGCELDPLVHYFRLYSSNVTSETNFVREHLFVRKNATVQLPCAEFGRSEHVDSAKALGFRPEDFKTQVFEGSSQPTCIIAASWADVWLNHYVNNRFGFKIACNLIEGQHYDLTQLSDEEAMTKFGTNGFPERCKTNVLGYIREMRENYTFYGRLTPDDIGKYAQLFFSSLPPMASTFFILPSEYSFDKKRGPQLRELARNYNVAIRRVSVGFPGVKLCPIDDHIESDSERLDGFDHFTRAVYFRMFSSILRQVQALYSEYSSKGGESRCFGFEAVESIELPAQGSAR